MGRMALAGRLGMDQDTDADRKRSRAATAVMPSAKDYFQERDGVRFAGMHLLVDMWGARGLADRKHIEKTLVAAARAAGATLLHTHLHQFSSNGGISGVITLAESHISIHTWPERAYAAIDVFMCGDCDPRLSLPVLREAFAPDRFEVDEHRRGQIP